MLVDEYQDVNIAQYRLVALLAAHHGNITVVGDDDQSIYSWRGSDYRMILRFEEDFDGAKIFKLEENYRSTQPILDAANALVANNRTRAAKKLFTRREAGEPITVYPAATERDEARYVVEKVKSSVRDGAAYRDFLVLYRTNAQSRVFEEGVARRRHPVSRGRRRRLLRARRSQRHDRVSALHPQSVGRDRVQAYRQRAAPRHRAADAGRARAIGQRVASFGRRSDLRRRTAAFGRSEEAQRTRALRRADRRLPQARRHDERRRPARQRDGRLGLRARTSSRGHARRARALGEPARTGRRRARLRSQRSRAVARRVSWRTSR